MASINWQNGQLITMHPGDTALCAGGLNYGQIYALFFYNSAMNDANCNVSVVWSNSQPPVQVTVPGTTAKEGLASLCFVYGGDTNTVSAAVTQGQSGSQVQAFIGSVKMPVDTSGINNMALPLNGQPQAFKAFTRFYAVPQSHWYTGMLQSNINQFISVQFIENQALVNIVNSLSTPNPIVYYCGQAQSFVKVNTTQSQQYSWSLQGNGGQSVWINADSVQNSQSASITVQSLAEVYEHLAKATAR